MFDIICKFISTSIDTITDAKSLFRLLSVSLNRLLHCLYDHLQRRSRPKKPMMTLYQHQHLQRLLATGSRSATNHGRPTGTIISLLNAKISGGPRISCRPCTFGLVVKTTPGNSQTLLWSKHYNVFLMSFIQTSDIK